MKPKPLFNPFYQNFNFESFYWPNHECKKNFKTLRDRFNHKHQVEKSSLTLLIGPYGSGKTHLLKSLVNEAIHRGLIALYLPFSNQKSEDLSSIVQGFDLICIDNIEQLSGKNSELAVYDLINKKKFHLVIASEIHPEKMTIINDLKTRLTSENLIKVDKLSVEQLSKAIVLKCREKSIKFQDQLVHSFLKKTHRNMHSINKNIDELVMFAEGKKITANTLNQFFDKKRK